MTSEQRVTHDQVLAAVLSRSPINNDLDAGEFALIVGKENLR